MTRAYNLPARYVIHTVGPIVNGTVRPEQKLELARCYQACLDVTAELSDVRSLAFRCISTGVFGFPKAPAAATAIRTVSEWLRAHPTALDLVVFNVFSDDDRLVYEQTLRARREL